MPSGVISSTADYTCQVVVTSNQALTASSGGNTGLIAGAAGGAAGGVIVLVVLVVIWLAHTRRRYHTPQSPLTKMKTTATLMSKENAQHQLEQLLASKVEQLFTLAFAGHFMAAQLTVAIGEFAALEVARKRIKMDRVIGQGQSGDVLLGKFSMPAHKVPVPVAVKIFRKDQGGFISANSGFDTAGEEALQLEARLLHQLRHPHIVRVLAVVTKSLPTLICLEYMQNGDLKTYLRFDVSFGLHMILTLCFRYRACRPSLRTRKAEVSEADVVRVLMQVCSALAFLEREHVVHRDIAARNVLVGEDLACVKLGDLGATRVLGMLLASF
jgi:hypothetical protein